jgi:hypothetical protein
MATVVQRSGVFAHPAPVSANKRKREEINSVTTEKNNRDMAEWIKLEAKFLASTSEVSALNSMQQMRDMLIQIPALSVLIRKDRVLQLGKSKRSVNPDRWSAQMAKSFGKLIMTVVMSMKRIETSKRRKMVNISVASPRNSVAALQLLALATAGSSKKSKPLVVKIKKPLSAKKDK